MRLVSSCSLPPLSPRLSSVECANRSPLSLVDSLPPVANVAQLAFSLQSLYVIDINYCND